jgi:hypothetical protein
MTFLAPARFFSPPSECETTKGFRPYTSSIQKYAFFALHLFINQVLEMQNPAFKSKGETALSFGTTPLNCQTGRAQI